MIATFHMSSAEPDAVDAAVRDLVRARQRGDAAFIEMPMVFPGGTAVTVRVARSKAGYTVSDNGFTYRELEAIGAERSFGFTGETVAQALDVERDRRALFVHTAADDLARAICDVASASFQIVAKVYADRNEAEEEEEIEDSLSQKLISLFGQSHVVPNKKVKGVSAIEWPFSAYVENDGKRAVFQAVSQSPQSIYKANSAFHDVAGIERPPALVAVVRSKAQLGPRLSILAQAGSVIEESQPDEVFVRAAMRGAY